eukprot:gnl/TRDRNA2_/TRDRNA2_214222_c0_seq1.p1 gnl/TRDRNA2_/TRDRNA2_214222_c0~~gnl/TRDRNA2_/TRDRNA2_214222_c0_seq1.p1  ORF type:complete len:122 (-),score=6.19 gnl/TRDRNA2_/TRDRNA2_214222_c0_seq1:35-400(-)
MYVLSLQLTSFVLTVSLESGPTHLPTEALFIHQNKSSISQTGTVVASGVVDGGAIGGSIDCASGGASMAASFSSDGGCPCSSKIASSAAWCFLQNRVLFTYTVIHRPADHDSGQDSEDRDQ